MAEEAAPARSARGGVSDGGLTSDKNPGSYSVDSVFIQRQSSNHNYVMLLYLLKL